MPTPKGVELSGWINAFVYTDILTYHVAADKLLAEDLADGMVIETVNGKSLAVALRDGKVMINSAQVVMSDVETDNGVIHVINQVILPG